MPEFDDMDDDVSNNESEHGDDSPDEDELPTLADMYGYENEEDNEEAALDDVLKMQENSSD